MDAVTELRSLGEVRGQLFGVRLVEFSPDGLQVATGDVAMELALWRDGRVAMRWDMAGDDRWWHRGDRIRAASFTADGRSLLVASGDNLWCLDTVNGSVQWQHRSHGILAFLRNSCLTTATLPSGEFITTYDDGRFEIRRRDGRMVARWAHRDCPRHLFVLDAGATLVGADTFAVGVWDTARRVQVSRFVPQGRIGGMAAVGPMVAIRTLEELVLWNRLTKEEIFRVPSPIGLPCIDLRDRGDYVAVAELDAVSIYDLSGRQVARADAKGSRVLAVKFAPDGLSVVAGCMDGAIRSWDVGRLARA